MKPVEPDPRDKKFWRCDKCGAEAIGSAKSVFDEGIWHLHEGKNKRSKKMWQLVLGDSCEPLVIPEALTVA